MKALLDLNLPRALVKRLEEAGMAAVHWSDVGSLTATDAAIMEWARQQDFVVITRDLDFGAILAATGAVAPSVIQAPLDRLATVRSETMREHADDLAAGALISVDLDRGRLRLLPLQRR